MEPAEYFIGNISPGTSGNLDVYLPTAKSGYGEVEFNIIYEDENGEEFFEKAYVELTGLENTNIVTPVPEVKESLSTVPSFVFAVVVSALLIVVVILYIKLKKGNKKLASDDELAEIEALDFIEAKDDIRKNSTGH